MDEATYAAVLDSIYDAALDARFWPRALELMADALQGGPAAFLLQDQLTMLGSGAIARLDPEALERHYRDFGTKNPLTADNNVAELGDRLPIITDEVVVPKRELMASEYYNEFFEPNGMHSALMISLGARGRSFATVNIMRPEHAPQFDSAEIELSRQLQPHLVRAFRLAVRLADAGHGNATLAEVMERSPHGLFLLGSDGRVQRANRAGIAMLGDGLAIVQGELTAASLDAARRLRRLVGDATVQRRSGALTLPRPSLRRPLSVIATPLGREATDVFDLGPAALVSVSDPDAVAMPDASLLAQLFDLSPAEIRIACRLLLGDSPQQAAVALGIGVSTARWHLAAIYRKTGAGRQAELVRLLLSLPTSTAEPKTADGHD